MSDTSEIDTALMQADVKRMTAAGEKELAEADGIRMASEKYTADRDLANQLLGRAQMAQAISKISAVAELIQLKQVKEQRLYRSIDSATAEKCTWSHYCAMLGKKNKHVDEQIAALSDLGPDAFEAIQSIGLSRSSLRKLRELPEEDRQIIVESEAIDTGDKEAVQELLEDIIAKHAKEKDLAEQRETTLKDSLDASAKIMADKDARFNAMAKELHTRSGRSLPWDQQIAPMKDEMGQIGSILDEVLGKMLIMHKRILDVDVGDDVRDVARRSLVTKHYEVLERAAVLVAECQGQFDLELGGYIGSMRDFIMQVPGDDVAAQDKGE